MVYYYSTSRWEEDTSQNYQQKQKQDLVVTSSTIGATLGLVLDSGGVGGLICFGRIVYIRVSN